MSRNYNGLDAVFQRMRRMQAIATSLARLAMLVKASGKAVNLPPFFL